MNINISKHTANQSRDLQNDNMINLGSQKNVSRMTKVASEYSVDISSRDKDIKAFGMEDLKSFDDVKNKAAIKDVSLESNALAVMSNSMSGEDLAKAMKDGFSPADMSVEDTVTNIDKIKATMAASGAVIPGYTDDLSTEDIAKITGSVGMAMSIENALKDNQVQITKDNVKETYDALKLSESVPAMTDAAKTYMINNDLEPTVNNLYMAGHSAANDGFARKAAYYRDENGYVGKNPTDNDFNELKPQIEKIISESGLDVNEETMNSAKWLIDKNIPLTEDKLSKLNDIDGISFPLDKDLVAKASAKAISEGKNAKDGNLTDTESLARKAGKFYKEVSDYIDSAEKNPSIANSELGARRLLEETRLALTMEASVSLIKKGIQIDTKDLQNLVEELKKAEKEYFEPLLMDEKREDVPTDKVREYDDELELKLDLYKQTTKAVEDIKYAPLDVLASATADVSADAVTSLNDFVAAANNLKADYEKAGKSYETMMTAPRYDMGDSIRKAFRNVDDILEDLDFEVNRLNEKAVRALGYAGIEINESNINAAVKAEVAVENVITHMTPARTLKMIRDGENPLDTDLYKLADKLMEEDDDTSNMKYAEFLYKLEKSGDITESEKKAFIGMYRLFNKIEKSDGKLVGDVIKADEKLTLSNILSAARSDRQIGNDYKIDDSFGTLEKLISSGESITDQILAGFKEKNMDADFAKAEAESIREMLTKEEAVLRVLENVDEPKSPVNMAAVDAMINSRGSFFKGLKDNLSAEDEDELDESFAMLQDSFDDEESVKGAYKSFARKSEEIIKKKAENADKYIDVKSMKLLNRQLSIVNKMADSRTYEVPVEIDGELTSINLKLISDKDNAGKVKASFETEATGKVSAEFTLKDGAVSGFIVTENSYFEGIAKESEQSFRDEFANANVDVSSMYYTRARGLNIKGNYTEESDNVTPSTSQLYKLAKAIIKAVQK